MQADTDTRRRRARTDTIVGAVFVALALTVCCAVLGLHTLAALAYVTWLLLVLIVWGAKWCWLALAAFGLLSGLMLASCGYYQMGERRPENRRGQR